MNPSAKQNSWEKVKGFSSEFQFAAQYLDDFFKKI